MVCISSGSNLEACTLLQAEATQRSSTLQLQCNIDHDVEALLSPKSVSDEELFASPTAEGRLQASLQQLSEHSEPVICQSAQCSNRHLLNHA